MSVRLMAPSLTRAIEYARESTVFLGARISAEASEGFTGLNRNFRGISIDVTTRREPDSSSSSAAQESAETSEE
jgi:hypothetical protein